MTTTSKQVETVYGNVEVETVECDSCGNEILKEEANTFEIGDGADAWSGWACDLCVSEGPIEFPNNSEPGYRWSMGAIVLWPILTGYALRSDYRYRPYWLGASIGALLWGVLAVASVLILLGA